MRVRICKEVLVDTEVTIGIEAIRTALIEAISEARDNPRSFSIQQYVSACWEALHAIPDDQIALIGPANCKCVADGMRKLAERFESQAVLDYSLTVPRPQSEDDIAGREDPITGVPAELRGKVARLSVSVPG